MGTILITGGTGLIGKHLSKLLRAKGYEIAILSRSNSDTPNSYFWNIEKNHIDEVLRNQQGCEYSTLLISREIIVPRLKSLRPNLVDQWRSELQSRFLLY